MENSKRIAGLVGPVIMAIVVSEFPLVQPGLYDAQIPPVVYLSGVLLFTAGLALVRAHNVWRRDWTVLVTVSGWLGLAVGLLRMFAATRYVKAASTTEDSVFMSIEVVLFVLALTMTVAAYRKTP